MRVQVQGELVQHVTTPCIATLTPSSKVSVCITDKFWWLHTTPVQSMTNQSAHVSRFTSRNGNPGSHVRFPSTQRYLHQAVEAQAVLQFLRCHK